jgi:hypothetical protein
MQEQLRAQGVRLSHVRYAEIVSRANAYLSDHPEFIEKHSNVRSVKA